MPEAQLTPHSERLRILHVNKRYAPHIGGIETVVRQLAEGMAARGHIATVLCMAEHASDSMHNGVRVVTIPIAATIGSAPLSFAFVNALKTLALEHDIVHFQFPNPMGEIAWLLVRRYVPNVTTICTYQSDVLRPATLVPAYTILARRFLASMSDDLRARVKSLFGDNVLAGPCDEPAPADSPWPTSKR